MESTSTREEKRAHAKKIMGEKTQPVMCYSCKNFTGKFARPNEYDVLESSQCENCAAVKSRNTREMIGKHKEQQREVLRRIDCKQCGAWLVDGKCPNCQRRQERARRNSLEPF